MASDREGPRWDVPDWSPEDVHRDQNYLDEIHALRRRAEEAEERQLAAENELKTITADRDRMHAQILDARQAVANVKQELASLQKYKEGYAPLKKSHESLKAEYSTFKASQILPVLRISRKTFWKVMFFAMIAILAYSLIVQSQFSREQAAAYEERLTEIRLAVQRAEIENADLIREKQELEERLAGLGDAAALEEQVTNLTDQVQSLNSQLSRSQAALRSSQDEINRLKGENETLPSRIPNQNSLEEVVRAQLSRVGSQSGWSSSVSSCVRQKFLEVIDDQSRYAFGSRPNRSEFRDRVRDSVNFDTGVCFRRATDGDRGKFIDDFFYASGNIWDQIVSRVR